MTPQPDDVLLSGVTARQLLMLRRSGAWSSTGVLTRSRRLTFNRCRCRRVNVGLTRLTVPMSKELVPRRWPPSSTAWTADTVEGGDALELPTIGPPTTPPMLAVPRELVRARLRPSNHATGTIPPLRAATADMPVCPSAPPGQCRPGHLLGLAALLRGDS